MSRLFAICSLLGILVLGACRSDAPIALASSEEAATWANSSDAVAFGAIPSSEDSAHTAHLYRLDDGVGTTFWLSDFGARLVRVTTPDAAGVTGDVLLGFEQASGYAAAPALGATVGRYAGGFSKPVLKLGTRLHPVTTDATGGAGGFHHRMWRAQPVGQGSEAGVRFTLRSQAGEQGLPGTLMVERTYRLAGPGELAVEEVLRSDAPSVANIAAHCAFNLEDGGYSSVLDHVLEVETERTFELTPSPDGTRGTNPAVGESAFDPRNPTRLAAGRTAFRGVVSSHFELTEREGMSLAAILKAPKSGRVLELFTSKPSLLVTTALGVEERAVGHRGVRYEQNAGVILSPRHAPDAPNHHLFPTATVGPLEVRRNRTLLRLFVEQG